MAFHYLYAADILSDLRGIIPPDGEYTILCGNSAWGDTPAILYQYNAASAAADNYPDVVKPTLQTGNGRFIRADWRQANTDWDSVSGPSQLLHKPALPSTVRTTTTQSLSLVATGATGTQISATKQSTVRFSVSTSTTSTIGGPATSVVALKKCATNDATEANWTTVATLESDQTITLAVVLQSVQVVKGQLSCDLDAGWFVKLVNSGSGTHTEQFLSGEKTIYG